MAQSACANKVNFPAETVPSAAGSQNAILWSVLGCGPGPECLGCTRAPQQPQGMGFVSSREGWGLFMSGGPAGSRRAVGQNTPSQDRAGDLQRARLTS